MSFDNTQITPAAGYDVNNMVFGKPRDGSIPNSSVTFKRIPIGTRNPDGSLGELILPTERLFSFGVSPSTNITTGKTDGYTLALCLQTMNSPTKEELTWLETFNAVCDHARDYILTNRDSVGKYDLEKADLKKFNPVYIKREKGKIVEGSGPMLYAKLLQTKKNDSITITSIFYDEYSRDIDPMTLLNKQCYVKGAIKIEGIFIGSKVSLQVKLHEAEIKMKDSGVKRLLRPMGLVSNNQDAAAAAAAAIAPLTISAQEPADSDEDDKGSLKGDDDDEVPAERPTTPPPPPAKAPVRRVAAKK